MFKSENEIYMDYQALLKAADRLDELAGETRRAQSNYVSGHCRNSKSWEGDSGAAFREKLFRLGCKLDADAKNLERTASSIRRAAQKQYQLEMKLAALIHG